MRRVTPVMFGRLDAFGEALPSEARHGQRSPTDSPRREAHDVRRETRSAGVATESSHRRVLAVLRGGLNHLARPDRLHGQSLGATDGDRIAPNEQNNAPPSPTSASRSEAGLPSGAARAWRRWIGQRTDETGPRAAKIPNEWSPRARPSSPQELDRTPAVRLQPGAQAID
jgi:hypothetical protein